MQLPFPPVGYVYLLDELTGAFLTDEITGAFLIVEGGPYKPPNNSLLTTSKIIDFGGFEVKGPVRDRKGRNIRWD